MQLKVLYENDIKKGYAAYTIIEIPDDDFTVLIDLDYQQRLNEAKPNKKDKVKKFTTIQEVFDEMNRKEYNAQRRFYRHKGEIKMPFKNDDDREEDADFMRYIPDNYDEEERSRKEEYEHTCELIRRALGKKQDWADMFIAVRIDGVPIREYAKSIGVDENNVSQKLKRAEKKLREVFKNRKI